MNSYFIVGTDTDCGKTYATCRLVDRLKQLNRRVLAIKPVASGCLSVEGRLVSQDELCLQEANGALEDSVCGWRFLPPVSPHLAAQSAGVSLSLSAIADYCAQFSGYDPLVIEGAGGLMVPLNSQETWLDFLTMTKIPVILVVGLTLGCINHALLTASVLESKGLKLVGWVGNEIDPSMLAMEENVQSLVRLMPAPLLARIPFRGSWQDQVDWSDLLNKTGYCF